MTTAKDVLTCDACRGSIDELQSAMIDWETADYGGQVTALALNHKGRCDQDLLYSAELVWFSEPASALRRLAELCENYQWTAEQLSKLTKIAWAASAVGKPRDRARAKSWDNAF